MATNPKAKRPGDPLWVAIAAVLTAHPVWTDVRVGLDVGGHRKRVARVRASRPPAAGKRQARDGRAYTPRGEGRRAVEAAHRADPAASPLLLAERTGASASTAKKLFDPPCRRPRVSCRGPTTLVAHPCG